MVDDATGKWLGAWAVPSNRMGEIVAYLFLSLVEKFGGMSVLLYTTIHAQCPNCRDAPSVIN